MLYIDVIIICALLEADLAHFGNQMKSLMIDWFYLL